MTTLPPQPLPQISYPSSPMEVCGCLPGKVNWESPALLQQALAKCSGHSHSCDSCGCGFSWP